MIIGLTYDLKEKIVLGTGHPEDALEEYDSPETVNGLAAALESMGHFVVKLGGGKEFLENVLKTKVDIVFNISEGLGNYRSREAQVPSVLEMLDIPYLGADPLCLSVCLDKPLTKRIVASSGIMTPNWQVVKDAIGLAGVDLKGFTYPAFIKPAQEGSSKGVRYNSRVENSRQAVELIGRLLKDYEQPVMIEEYIDGEEITVGIVGNCPPKVVGIMRVVPKTPSENFVYSLEVKRDWENLVEYEVPAKLDGEILAKLEKYSLAIFNELECRDFGRVDFKISSKGIPYFLEINPLAGLNPHSSDLPIMARKTGVSYQALIASILNAALDRYPKCVLK
jgi:D-alanine-D-alanine ligase